MKIRENYSYLLDEGKPLIPQLRGIKKSCFKPYVSDLQCIKHLCEPCSQEGKYSKCLFYEATHLDCFYKSLLEIMANKAIHPPKQLHPQLERLCYGRTKIEDILKPAWRLYKHSENEPKWIDTPEHKRWRIERRELAKALPCESTCKMKEWCSFFQNNGHIMLSITDIISYDEGEVYYDHSSPRIYDKGYITKSYLYKHFIIPTKVKELTPIKTDFGFKKVDNWQYGIYEKIYKKLTPQPKNRKSVVKYVLELLMQQEGAGELVMVYLFGLSTSFNMEEMEKLAKPYDININTHIKTLEKLGLVGTFEQTTELKKMRSLSQEFPHLITPTSGQILEIDISFLLEYVKQRNLEWFDPLYEWYLSQEKNPSRQDIEDKFKITRPTQVEIERRLGIRKDFRGIKGKVQYNNEFYTNQYVIGAIFRVLTQEEKKIRLEKAFKNSENNKKQKNKEKLPILTEQQLRGLEELHKQLISN